MRDTSPPRPDPSDPAAAPFDGAPPGREALRAAALACLDGDRELLRSVLGLFGPAAAGQADALARALADADAGRVAHCAHVLRGTLLSVGAAGSARLAAAIEDAARGGRLDGLDATARRLAAETAILVERLAPDGGALP
ncbi:MAG TPA: Hpt domain-containing protein [Burkholderiaceae bacterium]|nr:Hpt domain-containing protein [Burkholderiaceae bacterium]